MMIYFVWLSLAIGGQANIHFTALGGHSACPALLLEGGLGMVMCH
jgi:hypothetical protein